MGPAFILPSRPAAVRCLALSLAMAAAPAWGARAAPTPVWIDTDPACDARASSEVDDCWALIQALRSPALAIRGISTVFGNSDGATAFAIASALTHRFAGGQGGGQGSGFPAVFRGAEEGGGRAATAASRALGRALARERPAPAGSAPGRGGSWPTASTPSTASPSAT